MKQIVEDIRILLKDGTFKDEQHVRFSLVGRLCQALGWNIWNPEEFYTEYRVKRLPQQNITKDVTGRVDVALFIPEKTSILMCMTCLDISEEILPVPAEQDYIWILIP